MGLLDSRTALVTGASRGIGAAIARLFAAEGAAVAVTARSVEPGDSRFDGTITETVGQIRSDGGTATAVAADLARSEDRARMVAEVANEFGPIDILVNNAAVTYFEPVVDFDDRHRRLMFEVQVHAPFELAQLVLPSMIERRTGSILNISSKGALHPAGPPFERVIGGSVYGMVKSALERFTTGLASEVHRHGISVNALSPSNVVATPGVVHHRLITPERQPHVEHEGVMAAAALALVSGDADTMTGRIAYSAQLLAELGLGPEPLPEFRVGDHARANPEAYR